ncbi:MAG: response regulator transcription factor [Tannerellaceae bacterium]|jgi:DNA-binding response OmpR family regulator|nr:response regulator transcription factor [Tannerellaceae bacterium]
MNKGQHKVFLFEKDENVSSMLQEFMQMNNIASERFADYNEAYKAFCNDRFDICLIDLEEEMETGFSFARKIMGVNYETILIFIGSRPTLGELTEAYKIGADDFIRKPFILEELYLRILAIIGRTHGHKITDVQIYQLGRYLFDPRKQFLSFDERPLRITTKECDLLKFLCEHLNSLAEREAILKHVWRNDSFHNARSMDVYMTKVRNLLKKDDTIALVNVHGKGYKLMTNVLKGS